MSVVGTLQGQQAFEELRRRFVDWLFDTLMLPNPPGTKFQYPKCPFCKQRPELLEVSGQALELPIREGSPLTLKVPKYKVLSCCSASYQVKHEGPSRLQARRVYDQAKR